ncbi:MAG: AAA family ATPase [Cyclobacteriaceae bacterium]
MPALNTIFYGPPGTGKTYLTSRRAVQLIEHLSDKALSEQYPTESRVELKAQFNRYQQQGRIALLTFHPSFAYEDFVEGIKPFKNERNELYYDVEDGIFKQLCFNAAYALYHAQQQRALDNTTQPTATNKPQQMRPFDALYFEFIDYLKRMMREGSEEVTFETRQGKAVLLADINQNNTLSFHSAKSSKTYAVTKQSLAKLYKAFPSSEAITHLSEDIGRIVGRSNTSVMWAAFHRLKAFETTRYQTYNYLLNNRRLSGKAVSAVQYAQMKRAIQQLDFRSLTPADYEKAGNYVLIIDEINRGNPASIFGELISLIEEDKRAGKSEALQTVLPYTREPFNVPPNLYIIGTMNTADRSVDVLDMALKRRFAFQSVPPDPSLLQPAVKLSVALNEPVSKTAHAQAAEPNLTYAAQKIHLDKLCAAINERLLWLKGEDYQIGHGYLMPVLASSDPLAALRNALYRSIIPLLEDYFMDDWEKRIMVLGPGFVEELPVPGSIVSSMKSGLQDPFRSQQVYRWRSLSDADFVKALQQIYENL